LVDRCKSRINEHNKRTVWSGMTCFRISGSAVILELCHTLIAYKHSGLSLAFSFKLLNFILLMWRVGRAPNSIPIYSYIQQDATSHSLLIFGNCSACFGWYCHPSSGANKTVSTASGICHTILLSAAIVEELEPVWVCCGWRKPPTTHHTTQNWASS
jgi:hypothetical protein